MNFLKKHKTSLILFVLLTATYAYFYQSTAHNEAARFDQARAILDEHHLYIDSFAYNTADVAVITVRGERHVYPAKAPGSSLIAVIPMAIVRTVVGWLGVPDWASWHVIVYLLTVLLVSIPSALAAIAIHDILKRIVETKVALLAVLAIWLGTILFPFSTLYFGHAQTTALLVGSFWILFRFRHGQFKRPRLMLCVAGLLAGFAVVNEYPAVFAALLLALYFASTLWQAKQFRPALPFIYGAVLMGLLLIGYNYLAFGKLFFVPYQALGTSSFAGMALGFAGIHWPGWSGFLHVLSETMIKPQRGLLFINPILLMTLPGFYVWYREKKFRLEFFFVAVIVLVFIVFNACYGDSIVYWGGGASTGPRQLVLMLPFLALPMAFGVRSWRNTFYVLFSVSVFFMLIATAVEPRIPYDYTNPVFDFFIPHFLDGQFGLNRDALFDATHQGIVGLSTAVNAGGLLRFPMVLQLFPLLAIWGIAVILFFKRRAFLIVLAIIVLAPLINRDAKGFYDIMKSGLQSQYWSNDSIEGFPAISQNEKNIDMNWRSSAPLRTPFSVRWSGTMYIPKSGRYILFLESDDGSRLFIDGGLIINDWGPHGMHRADKAVFLSAGGHPIVLEYHNAIGGGAIRLSWRTPDHPEETIPSDVFIPPEP